jgi:Protein of unknwon function (DUF3310)
MNDLINHPNYYAQCSEATRAIVVLLGISSEWIDEECILAIENHQFVQTSFHLGEVITHLWRYGNKPGEARKDLEKARWYLNRLNRLNPFGDDRYTYNKALEMIEELIVKDFMMPKFRKKPVVIEAIQFNGLEDYLKIVQWMKDNGDTFALADEVYYKTPIMIIQTLEGAMSASPGNWIIKGVKGEFYPCKPDIFEATYEAIELPPSTPPIVNGIDAVGGF